jgi:hypothetical protein
MASVKAFATEKQASASLRRDEASIQRGIDRALGSPQERLDPNAAGRMTSHLGHDFSQVRVHHDEEAARSALALGADAYTIGNDIVFASGRYDPESESGWHLLAHELAHVVQQQRRALAPGEPLFVASSDDALEQNADRAAERAGDSWMGKGPNRTSASGVPACGDRTPAGTASRVMVQRQQVGKAKPKAPAKKPAMSLIFGQTSVTERARDAVLHGGALFPGPDNAHVALSDDGLLGYDRDHVDPADPFRWEKLKFIVDSGAKVRVDLVSIIDEFDVLRISDGRSEKMPMSLARANALGATLPRVAILRAIQPKGTGFASPDPDTNLVFFTTDIGGPSTSSLAHELFGHLFLALKGVPFTHPKEPAEVKAWGTLHEEHGIKDPFGGTYKGTVREYIDLYVGSETFSTLKSPTQFVSRRQLRSALNSFKADFATKAKGKLNGPWEVPDSLGLSWEVISTNYAVAETADPKLLTSIEAELAAWYRTLKADQQYVLMSFLTDERFDILRKTKLASALRAKIKPPAGMRFREP